MKYVYDINLKQIQSVKLNWKPEKIERIEKSFNETNEFFAAFDDNKECFAICSFEPGKINYLDEFCADGMPGIGFTTLQKAIEFKYKKCWLMASPDYDKETDSFLEAKKLNEKYRNQNYLKEIKLLPSENPWDCPLSLFRTNNVSDNEVIKLFKEKFRLEET